MAKALNSDVPPRDDAERVTFATWAMVTGKAPGGIFNALPKLDGDAAAKVAQRLTERAEGAITVEDVVSSQNIEALADKVRGTWRRASSTASSARCGPGPRAAQGAGVRVPSGRRLDRGVRTAAQPPAGGHSDVRPRPGRGRDRGACAAVRAEADRVAGRRPVHPGRLVAGWCAGVRVCDRAEAPRQGRPVGRVDRRGARR